MGSIPANQIVNIVPSVENAGGTALDLNGVVLTHSTRAPIGNVISFPSAQSVGAYFGLSSDEYAMAQIYFAGFNGCTKTPGAMLLAQYNEAAVAAHLTGGNVGSIGLAALQALPSGSLTVVVDGLTYSASAVSLSTANSFSAAATLIATDLNAALPTGGAALTVAYDSVSGSFVIASGTTGALSTVAFATGTLAASLKLTASSGAILSQGADAAIPGVFMSTLTNRTTNWASFTTLWEPSTQEAVAFAAWNTAQPNRYNYVAWNTDVQNEEIGNTATVNYLIGPDGANSSGTTPLYSPLNKNLAAAFELGFAASVDYDAPEGRATLAFKSTPGLVADVRDGGVAATLKAAGIDFYGAYATANQEFTFMTGGVVTGPFKWKDSYINQIWLNNQLQLAVMNGLTQVKSVAYAASGYALIRAWLTDPLERAKTFGAIRTGVALSAAQIAELKQAAGGLDISQQIIQRGYYIQITPAVAQVRGARTSPPINIFYADGGSVQQITIASVSVQ